MVFALQVFTALLMCTQMGVAMAAGDDGFRELFPANPHKPPRILLEKVWGKDIEATSVADLERDRDVLLGTVTASREQWPLSIVVDYVGLELRKSDIPAERQGYFYLKLECPQEPHGDCGEDRNRYGRDKWGLETSGSFSRKSWKINGTTRDVHVMDGMLLRYKVNLGAQVNVYMSRALVPKTLETHRLRLRVFGGEISFTPPPKEHAKIGSLGKQGIVIILIVAGLIWLVRLVRPSATAPESPPRSLGVLLCILGSALVFASVSDTLLFYPVTGLLIAVSGMLLSIGSRHGLWAYGVMLAMAWGITIHDYAGTLGKDALMRVAMITLLGFYIFSARVRDRLGLEE